MIESITPLSPHELRHRDAEAVQHAARAHGPLMRQLEDAVAYFATGAEGLRWQDAEAPATEQRDGRAPV